MVMIRRLFYMLAIDAAFAFYGLFLGVVATESNLLGVLLFLSPAFLLIWVSKLGLTARTLGSSRLANFMDMYLAGLITSTNGVILGKTYQNTLPSLKQRILALYEAPIARSTDALSIFNASAKPKLLYLPDHAGVHTAYIAPTGAGKSAGHVIPNLLSDKHSSAVVLDFKGELLRETGGYRSTIGDVICIAPFGLPKNIDFPISTFNPLQLVDPNSTFFLDDAASIANSLVVRSTNQQQPYFDNASELVIKIILVMMLVEASAEECTLSELRNIVTVANGHLESAPEKKTIRYPKGKEKPPFQTWQEIEKRIGRGGLSENEVADLWECLFLNTSEVANLLKHVNLNSRHGFIYPAFAFAAHTGARRSEIARSQIADIDFDSEMITIRELKRVRGMQSTRRVPMSPFLKKS